MGRSSPFPESTCDPSTIVFPTSRGSVISPSSVISITALALLIELRFLLPQTSERDKTKLRTAEAIQSARNSHCNWSRSLHSSEVL